MASWLRPLICLILLLGLSACGDVAVPELPELPTLTLPDVELPDVELPDLEIPTIELPKELADLEATWRDLGLPDLSAVPNLPALGDLPIQQTPPGAINYNGPTEIALVVGDVIRGTNIKLTAINGTSADFTIDGQRVTRQLGDALDYDGPFVGLNENEYHLRLRIYSIGDTTVRAAGVQQLILAEIAPTASSGKFEGTTIQFPFTVGVNTGDTIAGTTLRYQGGADQGAHFGGLAEGEYAYRKLGDSLVWQGHVRSDVLADYQLRILFYNADQARVGGIVTLTIR